MNKSKFLKRSLATLLAILMVVAMVPMSAFAAAVVAQDVPTARVGEDPGYKFALNGVDFVWDASLGDNGGYRAPYQFTNDGHGTIPKVQLSMMQTEAAKGTDFVLLDTNQTLTFSNTLVDLKSAGTKPASTVYGEGVYEFTVETRKETPTGMEKKTYKLAINATIRPKSSDTEVKGIYSTKMPQMLTYDIEQAADGKGGGKITITMTADTDLAEAISHDGTAPNGIALGATKTNSVDDDHSKKLKEIFIVDKTVQKLSLNKGVLTVTSEIGTNASYTVVLKHEDIFKTFKLTDADGVEYEGKTYNDDPEKIIVDLPYDKFYEDMGTDNTDATSDDYGATPNANITKMITTINDMKASWETDREVSVVKTGATLASAATATSGKTKLNFADATGLYDATNGADRAAYPNVNPVNGNGAPNYLIFTSRAKVLTDQSKTVKALFVDTKSRKVDSLTKNDTDEYNHTGEVEIIVRIPKYNPKAELTGIQIMGDKTNVAATVTEGATSGIDGSETWSQYIAVSSTSPTLTVPRDVLQDSASSKKDEKDNKRAYIKVWGSYGSVVEIPWDYVSSVAAGTNSDMDANGFNTTTAGAGQVLFGSGKKTDAPAISESSILLTTTNNSVDPAVKTVRINVTSQDGNTTVPYDIRVQEITNEQHPTDLKSVEIYKADGTTLLGTGVKNTTGDTDDWTVEIPYAVGSGDDGTGLPKDYIIKAVAQDGSRISYKSGAKAPSDTPSAAGDFKAFIKQDTTNNLLTASATIAQELTEPAANRIQPTPANYQFTLRVWDDDNIVSKDVYKDHTITITMPKPDKEMRIQDNGATVMANEDTPNDMDGVDFVTRVDNTKNEITVDVPYEYRNIGTVYFSKLLTDNEKARVFWDSDGHGTLEEVKLGSATVAGTDIITGTNGANWKNGNTIALYVFSEEAYSLLKHKKTSGDSVGTGTIDTIAKIDGKTSSDNYTYYRKYTMKANILQPERLNTLENSVTTDDDLDMIRVDVDNANNIINITVPHGYVNAKATDAIGSSPKHTFTLDFKTDGEKSRLYMGEKNDFNSTTAAAKTTNVQYINNGIPAGGIEEYVDADQSNAIVPKDTKFWVTTNDGVDGKNDVPVLYYAYQTDAPTGTGVCTTGTRARAAIVASEESLWGEGQDNGGTRAYTVNVKVADPETDPAIKSIVVDGVAANLRQEDEEGIATWTVALPANSLPHRKVEMTFEKSFTTAKLDGESYDKKAYYILSKYAPVTIVSTAENGANKRYILQIQDGDVSSDTSLQSIRVDGYTAVRDGATNNYYVSVGSNANLAEMSLIVTPNDSKAKIAVDSQTYTEGMKVSLDGKAVNITVTAESGATTTYTLTAGAAPVEKPSDKITDIKGIYLESEVKEAIDLGIVNGTSATTFTPNRAVTRMEFAVMIARGDLIADGKATDTKTADAALIAEYLTTGNKFSDVADLGDVYKAAINYCTTKNIIKGTGNGFNPKGTITRQEAAAMLARWTNTESGSTTNTKFSDWAKVSNWAKGAVNGVTSTNPPIMKGNSATTFDPTGRVTRDMAATLVKRVYVNYSSK